MRRTKERACLDTQHLGTFCHFGSSHFGSRHFSFKLFCSVIVFILSAVMPTRRSPRLAELAASQRAESVLIALDDDDTVSLQSTAVCAVCGGEGLRSSLVHIPCCDCLTQQCEWMTTSFHSRAHRQFIMPGVSVTQSILLQPAMRHSACSHVALSLYLTERIMR